MKQRIVDFCQLISYKITSIRIQRFGMLFFRIVSCMRKECRYLIYVILCLVVLLFPNIKEVCFDCGSWLSETIDHDYFKASLYLAVLLFFVDSLSFAYKRRVPINTNVYKTDMAPFYFDSPTPDDKFNRSTYAKLLLDKIFSSFYNNNSQGKNAKQSFVIHIGEHYGQGKTSFLMMLENEAEKCMNVKPVVYISFEPWLCDTETGIITEFFSAFRNSLKKLLPRLDKTIKDYAILLLSSVEYSSGGFSFDFSSFGKNQVGTLKENHDKIRDELQKTDRPIIIAIDDVDRLQSKELMMVLKIIRDTADFPNVFYIVAADNIHLKKMLNILHIDDAEKYLEKFFNLEFQLPANENVAFKELVKILRGKFEALQIQSRENCLQQIINVPHIKDVFPNLRDVYRFVNAYFLAIDSMQDVEKIDLFDLFLLTVIQMQDMEYYMQLRDNCLNILDVKRHGNDVILVWKKELNIVKTRNDRDLSIQFKRINAERQGEKTKEKEEEIEQKIPDFYETKVLTQITSDKIVPEIMNLLFGRSSNSVIGENQVCRYNMYFKYFANTDASYMVSRMEIVSILNADENTYRQELETIFKQDRDKLFLAEFTNAIPYTNNIQDTTILKRFFIFIELSYKYKREMTIPEIINSLADYEGRENVIFKLYPVLSYVYGTTRIERISKLAKQKNKGFMEFCEKYEDINILLVCVNIMSNRLGSFIFDRNDIEKANYILVNRFYAECVANSNGNINIQEADTIIQIKCDLYARTLWDDLFEKYLGDNKEACLNILCKLVRFYSNGNVEWSYSFHKALLGEYQLQHDNILLRLRETHTDLQEFLNSIISLHNNYGQSLLHAMDLENSTFIKMVKERLFVLQQVQ